MLRRTAIITALAPMSWGTTYAVTTAWLPEGRPLLAAAVRALPTGLLLVAVGRRLPPRGWWWRSAVLGTLNFGAFFALLFTAAYRLPGGVAATMGALGPLVVALLALVLLGERPTPVRLGAGVLGIVGVALLVLRADAALDPVGVLAAVAGTASMATGTVLVQRWGRPAPLLTFAGWQLAAGGLLLAPLAVATEGLPSSLTATNVGGYLYLAGIGAAVAYPLWFRGIERLGASTTAFLALLSPAVATAVGLVRGDAMTPWQGVGFVLVIVSVVLPVSGATMGLMARFHQIVVDARHPASLARFWEQAVDGFEIRPYDDEEIARLAALGLTPETDTSVVLDGPNGVELCFQQVAPLLPVGEKRPVHLDLRTADRDAEVDRLVGLGATVVERFDGHTWLRDPEGNDLCLADER